MHQDEQLVDLKRRSQDQPLSRRDFMRALTVAASAGSGMVASGLSGPRRPFAGAVKAIS